MKTVAQKMKVNEIILIEFLHFMWWDTILTLSRLWKVNDHVVIPRTLKNYKEVWLKSQ